jgi:hypothetical protein
VTEVADLSRAAEVDPRGKGGKRWCAPGPADLIKQLFDQHLVRAAK